MIKQCQQCSKDFKTYPALIKLGKGKFCSRQCSNVTDNLKVVVKCSICLKEFTTNQDRIKDGRGKFCSRPCYIEDWNKRIPGWNKGQSSTWSIGNQYRKGIPNLSPNKMFAEENPQWKGGHTVGKENRKVYFRFKGLQRFNRKRDAEGTHSLEEWKELKKKYKFTCLCCFKKEPEIILTQDHIKPISKGGSDYIQNIQPLCLPCNVKKHTKEIDYRIVN